MSQPFGIREPHPGICVECYIITNLGVRSLHLTGGGWMDAQGRTVEQYSFLNGLQIGQPCALHRLSIPTTTTTNPINQDHRP